MCHLFLVKLDQQNGSYGPSMLNNHSESQGKLSRGYACGIKVDFRKGRGGAAQSGGMVIAPDTGAHPPRVASLVSCSLGCISSSLDDRASNGQCLITEVKFIAISRKQYSGRAFKGPQMAGFVPFLAFLIEPVQDLCKKNLRSKPIGAYYLHGWTKLQLLKKSQVADG
jgi:hypothetical protein